VPLFNPNIYHGHIDKWQLCSCQWVEAEWRLSKTRNLTTSWNKYGCTPKWKMKNGFPILFS
jgi:hypothetical protein